MRIEDYDFKVGDVVQIIRHKEYTGRIGIIISILTSYDRSGNPMLLYYMKLSDKESASASSKDISLIRRADDE